jgi:hypothetical protein
MRARAELAENDFVFRHKELDAKNACTAEV